jgi:hypothetical protein
MVEKLYSLPVGFFFRGKELCFGHDLGGSTPEGQSPDELLQAGAR